MESPPEGSSPSFTTNLPGDYEEILRAHESDHRALREMRRDAFRSINAYSVVFVLLATVTFAGFLQPPGGISGRGELTVVNAKMKTFVVCNSVSFYLSVAALVLCISSLLPQPSAVSRWGSGAKRDPGLIQRNQLLTSMLLQSLQLLNLLLYLMTFLFTLSLYFCAVAFTAAGYVVTTNSGRYSFVGVSVLGLLVIGTATCLHWYRAFQMSRQRHMVKRSTSQEGAFPSRHSSPNRALDSLRTLSLSSWGSRIDFDFEPPISLGADSPEPFPVPQFV